MVFGTESDSRAAIKEMDVPSDNIDSGQCNADPRAPCRCDANNLNEDCIMPDENCKKIRLDRSRKSAKPLLGSFEENALNDRLDPIRTVDGYVAEVRAASSQSKLTRPLKKKFQVNIYSAGAGSYPYVGQVPIEGKGYKVPRAGTLQVTLFNPNGTLVKLFLLRYDLNDMPKNSQTILRQTTYFQPTSSTIKNNSAITDSSSKIGLLSSLERQVDGYKTIMGQKFSNISESDSDFRRVRYLIQLK